MPRFQTGRGTGRGISPSREELKTRALSAVALLAVGIAVVLGFRGNSPRQEYPDAVTADPDHYSVEAENDVARVLRIRYGAGETSVMHHHPANCAILVTDASVNFELPSGETEEAPGEAGQVNCGDAGVHKPSNTGDDSLEAILIEFKGREKFAK